MRKRPNDTKNAFEPTNAYKGIGEQMRGTLGCESDQMIPKTHLSPPTRKGAQNLPVGKYETKIDNCIARKYNKFILKRYRREYEGKRKIFILVKAKANLVNTKQKTLKAILRHFSCGIKLAE